MSHSTRVSIQNTADNFKQIEIVERDFAIFQKNIFHTCLKLKQGYFQRPTEKQSGKALNIPLGETIVLRELSSKFT